MATYIYANPSQDPRLKKKYQYSSADAILEQLLNEQNKANQPQQAVKQSGKGGFLSSLISEGGGIGGAAGGAALGTAILPGVGTLIGAGLGGFAGAFGGRLAENKIRDDEYKVGSALTEGTLTGALSALGPAFQMAKGAKGAKALSSAIGGADDVLKGVKPTNAAIGAVEKKGLGMTSKAGGYFVGATRPGVEPLSPAKVMQYDKLLRKLKIPANDASDLLYGIEPKLSQVYKTLENGVVKSSSKVNSKQLADNLLAKINAAPGLGSAENKFAAEQALKLSKVSSPSDLLQFKRGLDKSISYVANPDAATQSKQAVSQIFRKGIKDELDTLVPGLEQQNSIAHDLASIRSFASRAANRTGVESTSAGGGLFSRALSSPTANTLKAKTGAATQAVGRSMAGTGGQNLQFGRYAKLQAPLNLAEAIATTDMQAPTEPQMQPVTDSNTQIGGTTLMSPELQQPAQQTMSLQEALAMAQQTLGPDATAPQYLSYAKAFMDASQTGGNGLDSVAKRQAANLDSATQIVNQLKGLYDNAGGAQGFGGYITKLTSKTPLNSEQKAYTDQRGAYVSRIVRALGEVGTLNEGDIQRAVALIPDYTDTPESANLKWQGLMQVLDSTRQSIYSNGGGGALQSNDLINALSQAQYGM